MNPTKYISCDISTMGLVVCGAGGFATIAGPVALSHGPSPVHKTSAEDGVLRAAFVLLYTPMYESVDASASLREPVVNQDSICDTCKNTSIHQCTKWH